MLEKLKDSPKVVGTRRLLKTLANGSVDVAFLGSDADLFIVRQVRSAAEAAGVRLVEQFTMKQLGEACGVEVPTAACGLLR